MLVNREQIGQELARVIVVAKRIDNRNVRVRSHLFKPAVCVGSPDDCSDLTVKHASSVGNTLLATHLTGLTVDDQWHTTEVGHTDRKRHPGAGRGFVENEGNGLWPGIGARAVWRLL